MILVTGAAGKTGRAVTQALVARGRRVRALVRRPEQISLLEELGATEVVTGDLRSESTLDHACWRVEGIYHISPNMHPEELAVGQVAIRAARVRGVGHFVYHSVLHPQTESMPHHWKKLRVEETLFESSIPFTILQPASYMQNLLPYWTRIVNEGVYALPYGRKTRLSPVNLGDVAEAAASVVATPGHLGATYELCGPEVLSQDEMAAILSRQLEHGVRVEVVPPEEWEREARASGMGGYRSEPSWRCFVIMSDTVSGGALESSSGYSAVPRQLSPSSWSGR